MSRGPGKIERAIEAAFTSKPDDIFTTEDLVALAYPGANRPEKKHRVAVIRAAGSVCSRLGWGWLCSRKIGSTNVYVNLESVRSYMLGKLRIAADTGGPHGFSADELRAMVDAKREPPDNLARIIEGMHPGQAYWAHMQIHRAEVAGRHEEAAAIRDQLPALIYRRIPAIQLPESSAPR